MWASRAGLYDRAGTLSSSSSCSSAGICGATVTTATQPQHTGHTAGRGGCAEAMTASKELHGQVHGFCQLPPRAPSSTQSGNGGHAQFKVSVSSNDSAMMTPKWVPGAVLSPRLSTPSHARILPSLLPELPWSEGPSRGRQAPHEGLPRLQPSGDSEGSWPSSAPLAATREPQRPGSTSEWAALFSRPGMLQQRSRRRVVIRRGGRAICFSARTPRAGESQGARPFARRGEREQCRSDPEHGREAL